MRPISADDLTAPFKDAIGTQAWLDEARDRYARAGNRFASAAQDMMLAPCNMRDLDAAQESLRKALQVLLIAKLYLMPAIERAAMVTPPGPISMSLTSAEKAGLVAAMSKASG